VCDVLRAVRRATCGVLTGGVLTGGVLTGDVLTGGVLTGYVPRRLQTPDYTMDRLRVDVWLDVACLFRTRSEAQKACKTGRVQVNRQTATPHRDVRPGDEIVISRPLGRKQILVVRGLAERHLPKAEARALYEDLTPKPTDEEIEMRRIERLTRALNRTPAVTPDKRERRRIRKLKRGSSEF